MIRLPTRRATTIPHPFPLCVFASLRETLSAQVSKYHNHRNLTPRCARVCGPGGLHHVLDRTMFKRTTFRRTTRTRTMFSIDI